MESIRIAKLIAGRGLASRREAEEWIREGRVKVNGEVLENPGVLVDPGVDHIRVDGVALPEPQEHVYYLMYKPRGTITSRKDPQGRKSVIDLLGDVETRVEPVGRLDFDTEGALIFTNDGETAHKLTHPSTRVPKRYIAKVWRTPDERTLERLRKGIHLEDGKTAPCKVRILDATDGGNARLEITVTEGRNRLIRRMLQAVNHPVSKLRRESFATLSVRDMERSQVRRLTSEEVRRLKDLAEGRNPTKAGQVRKRKGFAKAKPKKKRHGTRSSRKGLAQSRKVR
jgi:pseudouridine synthase